MAEIKVERKGRSVWPWIVGLVVLAVLVWFLIGSLEGDDVKQVQEEAAGAVESVTNP